LVDHIQQRHIFEVPLFWLLLEAQNIEWQQYKNINIREAQIIVGHLNTYILHVYDTKNSYIIQKEFLEYLKSRHI
jgi:hypothetical protein